MPRTRFAATACIAVASPATLLRIARSTPLAFAAFALAPAAQAQSLVELYQAAHAYDAPYLAAKAQADSVQYRLQQARSAERPAVNLAAGRNAARSNTPIGNRDSDTTSVGLTARQTVFNRGNEFAIRQAERQLEIAQADVDTAEQDLIVRVAQAYFDVLGAKDSLAFAKASKTQITEQLAAAKRNFEVGTATITDTREAQARYDLAVANEIAAENDLRTKRIALDQLVGRTGTDPKPLATPVNLPPVQPSDVETWVTSADNSPSVRKARVGYDIAQLATARARAAKLPSVDVTGGLQRSHGYGNGVTIPGTINQATVGIQLSMPLYSGGLIEGQVGESLALEEQSRNNLDAARRGTAQATRQAYFGVQSLEAQVKALEAAESSSQLALEATQLGYRVGVRVNIDVLNAQTQLFSTRRDLAAARYNVIVNGLKLRQAAGTLSPQDVDAANGLLVK